MVLKNLQSIAFLCLLDYRINCMAESMADDVKYGGGANDMSIAGQQVAIRYQIGCVGFKRKAIIFALSINLCD